MTKEDAIVTCKTCGKPAKVVFENGDIVKTYSVCEHIPVVEAEIDRAQEEEDTKQTWPGW